MVQAAWSALQRRYEARQQSDFYEVVIPSAEDEAEWPQELSAEMVTVSKVNFLKDELRALQVDLPTYLQKVKDLKLDAIEKVHGKERKEAEKKQKEDVEMQDVASGTATEVQTTINKEVQRQVAAALKASGLASGSSPPKQVSNISRVHQNPTRAANTYVDDNALAEEDSQGEKEGEERRQACHQPNPQKHSPTAP